MTNDEMCLCDLYTIEVMADACDRLILEGMRRGVYPESMAALTMFERVELGAEAVGAMSMRRDVCVALVVCELLESYGLAPMKVKES